MAALPLDGDLDFGDGRPIAPRLNVAEWIREVADDQVAEQLADPFCIEHGLPRLNEGRALYNFFPRLVRGITCKNGRTLIAERGNVEDRYGPDLVVRFTDAPAGHVLAIIDVERKTRDQLFLSPDLPINVPYLTLRAHQGKTPYQWSDGTWRKAGKIRYFEAFPDGTFFLAVAPDGLVGLLVTGRDIVARSPEWMPAAGGFKDDQIFVVRVPRCRAVLAKVNEYTIENAIMNSAMVVAALRADHVDEA